MASKNAKHTTAAEVHCCQTATTLTRLPDSCTWQAESRTMPGLSWSVLDIFQVHCCQTATTLARLPDSCTWQAESRTMPGLSWSVLDIFQGILPQGTSVPRREQSGP